MKTINQSNAKLFAAFSWEKTVPKRRVTSGG
jgi:hypothetical protein